MDKNKLSKNWIIRVCRFDDKLKSNAKDKRSKFVQKHFYY